MSNAHTSSLYSNISTCSLSWRIWPVLLLSRLVSFTCTWNLTPCVRLVCFFWGSNGLTSFTCRLLTSSCLFLTACGLLYKQTPRFRLADVNSDWCSGAGVWRVQRWLDHSQGVQRENGSSEDLLAVRNVLLYSPMSRHLILSFVHEEMRSISCWPVATRITMARSTISNSLSGSTIPLRKSVSTWLFCWLICPSTCPTIRGNFPKEAP